MLVIPTERSDEGSLFLLSAFSFLLSPFNFNLLSAGYECQGLRPDRVKGVANPCLNTIGFQIRWDERFSALALKYSSKLDVISLVIVIFALKRENRMRLGIKKQVNLFCSPLAFHYFCNANGW